MEPPYHPIRDFIVDVGLFIADMIAIIAGRRVYVAIVYDVQHETIYRASKMELCECNNCRKAVNMARDAMAVPFDTEEGGKI